VLGSQVSKELSLWQNCAYWPLGTRLWCFFAQALSPSISTLRLNLLRAILDRGSNKPKPRHRGPPLLLWTAGHRLIKPMSFHPIRAGMTSKHFHWCLSKPIIYAQIMLWFPDTMNANPDKATTSYKVIVGRRPESALYYKDGSKIQKFRKTQFRNRYSLRHVKRLSFRSQLMPKLSSPRLRGSAIRHFPT
jgi:hypothetical protein